MSTDNAVSIRLTPADHKRFRAAEAQIDADIPRMLKHQGEFVKYAGRVGEKLALIKERGWHQATHGTWPKYLAERFPGLKKSQAHNYIAVAGVIADIWGEGSSTAVEAPSVKSVLPLAQLDSPESRRAAWDAAAAGDEAPTADDVSDLVERMLESDSPEEQQEIAAREGERIRSQGKRVEREREEGDRERRWRKILVSARVALKDARALGGEGEDVAEWLEQVILRCCSELDEDPADHKVRREAA